MIWTNKMRMNNNCYKKGATIFFSDICLILQCKYQMGIYTINLQIVRKSLIKECKNTNVETYNNEHRCSTRLVTTLSTKVQTKPYQQIVNLSQLEMLFYPKEWIERICWGDQKHNHVHNRASSEQNDRWFVLRRNNVQILGQSLKRWHLNARHYLR